MTEQLGHYEELARIYLSSRANLLGFRERIVIRHFGKWLDENNHLTPAEIEKRLRELDEKYERKMK